MAAIGILAIVELLLFATNYTPNTWLIGWDNLNPEFDFKTNILRNIFGVWQEYRGLGLYDGMSHIANTLHTIALWIMSLVIPTSLLRYVFIFGTHLIGGIGMYFLLRKAQTTLASVIALAGSIFYLLNLTTIQIFHTPLESFSIHFAALPWLALTLREFLHEPRQKQYISFLLVCLLAAPQFFVPTILLPTTILLIAVSLPYVFSKQTALSVWKAGVGFVLINAFWLLPYLWGLSQNAPVIQDAKINQMSSSEAYLRNQAFGNISDVLLLRGFPLDFEDYTESGVQTFLMSTWRSWTLSPIYLFVGGFIIALGALGIFQSIRKNATHIVVFLVPLSLSFIILANNTQGIAEIVAFVRSHVPFLGEALRFPYTKFGLLFAFSLTIFIHQGLTSLIAYAEHHRIYIRLGIIGVFIFLVAFMAHPVFLGQFINQNMRVSVPSEYKDLYAFLRTKSANDRMVLLPQPTYWSWKLYQFGYRGSGFSWFGIPQPTLDRAFDPWSKTSENFYWELSSSLYSKNIESLAQLFNKYDITYILVDKNLATTGNNRSLFIEENNELLSQIPNIKRVTTFGELTLYENIIADANSFISVKNNLPSVNSYSWTDNDIAYQELGDYIEGADITYRYRELFTKRSVSERKFDGAELVVAENLVYDSTISGNLMASMVVQCGLQKEGASRAQDMPDGVRFASLNQRDCLSFSIPDLAHKDGYIVAVESRHIRGRPLLLSFINETAKHLESESYLPTTTDWNTTYFILPPLASDGLGYNMYISNDSIGRHETVNELRSIRIYTFPHNELVHMRTRDIATPSATARNDITVYHPNPAYYKVILDGSRVEPGMTDTLMLSQSFDPGWIAVAPTISFPFLTPVGTHVLVNNWSNGWTLQSNEITNNQETIYIFFWPQLLEFLGFALLPLPFLWIFRGKTFH